MVAANIDVESLGAGVCAEVPFAEVDCGVASGLQRFGNGHILVGQDMLTYWDYRSEYPPFIN